MTKEDPKTLVRQSFRIIFETDYEIELLQLKAQGLTVAEHIRRAIRYYLMLRIDGAIPEMDLMRFTTKFFEGKQTWQGNADIDVEKLKSTYRTVLDPGTEESLSAMKQKSGILMAEYIRRAVRQYLLFRDVDGKINEELIVEFVNDFKRRRK